MDAIIVARIIAYSNINYLAKQYMTISNLFPYVMLLILISKLVLSTAYANTFEKKWEFELKNFSPTNTVQASPIEYAEKLFLVDGAGNLLGLNKTNGSLLFKTYLGINAGRRGFAIDHQASEIIITANNKLFTLSPQTGEILRSFDTIPSVVAPIITNSCYVVLGNEGDVQCHDQSDGLVKWKTSLGWTARIWSNALFFDKNDLIYFVTSNPGGIVYDSDRINDNYSSSLVALEASTGNIVFTKRMVFNDVWDFDGVGQPILVKDFKVNDSRHLDLIIALNKTGTIFAINAKDGSDVLDNQFLKVDFAISPGAETSQENSQYIPSWPERVSDIKIEIDDLRSGQFNPIKLRHAKFQEFLRPDLDYDVITKGLHGGPEWHGGIYHFDELKKEKILAIPTNNLAWILRVQYEQEHPLLLNIGLKALSLANKIKNRFLDALNRIELLFGKNLNETKNEQVSIDSRWIQNKWSNSSDSQKFINQYYKYLDFKSHNTTYRKSCASCHGYDRRGKYQSELYGDGYVPSLVGYTLTEKFSFGKNYKNLKMIHGNLSLPPEAEVSSMFNEFNELDLNLMKKGKLREKGFWQPLIANDSLPLNKGPWGSIKVLNLQTGKLKGVIEVGKSTTSSGEVVNSSVIFGGLGEATPQGKTMLTGTVDPSAYYISLSDLKIENVLMLRRSGSVNPYLTKIDNCEAWIFVESGGRFSFYDRSNNGFTVEAFINRDNCNID